ncbi:alpha/beta hydrolase [Flavobacterium macrobrachii]|uniref:Alpha/beta hydrolase n=1 Tax=Flavobacterium macrobrachii TaxID=591204 RepID=A0ABS2CZ54_9FLAO|nr:alpha/beta hydrolase-fold protein [Flavobacterium macrobrachii]MBM6500252.1 alpha/beta hydrolase [Flavobacterium macrobrachii]
MKKIVLLFLITTFSFAQSKIESHQIVDKEKFAGIIHRIDSFPTKFIVPRTVDIWLPSNYAEDKKYSVLYMQDGQMLFDSSSTWNKQEWMVDEVVSKLNAENKIEDMIVVAIWNIKNLRHGDLFPKKPLLQLSKDKIEFIYVEAQKLNYNLKIEDINSDNYLKFIVKELKPYIDKKYSVYTDAKHTAIMGSSMGGLISMYAICEYPKVFGKAACLSTHWVGFRDFENNPIPESFFAYMEKNLPNPKDHKIYFDYGTETLDASYLKYEYRIDEVLQSKGYTTENYKNLKFEGENHSEASWQKRINIPIEFMFGK